VLADLQAGLRRRRRELRGRLEETGGDDHPGDHCNWRSTCSTGLGQHWDDWDFHQATGMVAAQIHTYDMNEAASRLIAMAAVRGEPVHDTALLIICRELQLDC